MLYPQQVILLVTLVAITTVVPQQEALGNNEGAEDASIQNDYYTFHRFQDLNESTWPKKEDLPKSTKCGKGLYEQCIPCPLGYYKKNKKNRPCVRCDGTKSGTPGKGAEWCTPFCGPGKRLLEDGQKLKQRTCEQCDIGQYQPYHNVDKKCVPCPNNMTTNGKGSKTVQDCFLNCSAGQHPNTNNTACVPCPDGTYKANPGRAKCISCPTNRNTTAKDGAVDWRECKFPCVPGKEYNVNTGKCDIMCQSGTYKSENSLRTKCRPCPKNFSPNSNDRATNCVPDCGLGYEISAGEDNCTACGLGFFKNVSGNLPCQSCPKYQMTVSMASSDIEECKVFHECAKPLSEKLDSLFSQLDREGLNLTKSDSFIDLMTNTCRLGPNDVLVKLLEEVVNSFQTCGVLGQVNLREVEIGGKTYNKEHYLTIFRTAYVYGGMCDFVLCLVDAVPEIRWSKSLVKEYNPCPFTEAHCFCNATYRALATSFHHHLLLCPALQFHPEFLEINVGGTEMNDALLTATNVTAFCALSNSCDGIDCGHGTCSCLVTGGYLCQCRFGYTGTYCQTAQVPTKETGPDTTTTDNSATTAPPTSTTSPACPDPPEPPVCPTSRPCPECPMPVCPTNAPCTECPMPACPTNAPCPECPMPACPTNAPCSECPMPVCPTNAPCPECPMPACPTNAPCPECPMPVCPTNAPCPECPMPACPTNAPCPELPEPPTCPTNSPCPECPIPECPTKAPCPDCPTPPEPPTCPSCQVCPTTTVPPPPPTCASCPEPTPCPTPGEDKHRSCLELLKEGNTVSGIYEIYVESMGKHIEVYCDQDTDGGGWIVFQRRQDGSVDFYRDWNDYKDGFGQNTEEFWLGLDSLHHLTMSMNQDLRIDLRTFDYEKRYAQYSTFVVGSESSNYVLTSDGYKGNAGDSFGESSGQHNGQPFSTKDADHDAYSTSCAQQFKGAWWYKSCHYSNLNGLYLNGNHGSFANGINWYHWKGHYYSLKVTEMKLREWHDWTGTRKPKSCLEWLQKGHNQSGLYQIYVAGLDRNIEVYCDQDTDGGGWIVFQRRKDGSMDFYRGWNSYQFGFGQLEAEFWLGLESLHHLSTSESCDLRIDLQDAAGEKRYAQYSTFAVGSKSSHYVLKADGYTGNAGDSFGVSSGQHDGMPFSTKDADHDAYPQSCAQQFKGAWWYKSCHNSNLNGLYLNGKHGSFANGINWYHWKGHYYSLTFTEMKLREKVDN